MSKIKDYQSLERFGADVKEARKQLNISRKDLAEMVNISHRYLANIENRASLPSLPVFYELVHICKLPVEQYFFSNSMDKESKQRKRANLKLSQCPERYLSIIEGAMDGAIKLKEAENE